MQSGSTVGALIKVLADKHANHKREMFAINGLLYYLFYLADQEYLFWSMRQIGNSERDNKLFSKKKIESAWFLHYMEDDVVLIDITYNSCIFIKNNFQLNITIEY